MFARKPRRFAAFVPARYRALVAQPANRPSFLANSLAPVADFAPNPWNPNRMDEFMSEKLRRSIMKDGFFMPILVRPNKSGLTPWEIVDGAQRFKQGQNLGMTVMPYVNMGDISDEKAMQITIKANTLRGEFDSVELGKMIQALVADAGMASVADDLPYTPERLQGLVDLVSVDVNLTSPIGPLSNDAGDGASPTQPTGPGNDFKQFDPSNMKFDVKCPRCGMEFNLPKTAGPIVAVANV